MLSPMIRLGGIWRAFLMHLSLSNFKHSCSHSSQPHNLLSHAWAFSFSVHFGHEYTKPFLQHPLFPFSQISHCFLYSVPHADILISDCIHSSYSIWVLRYPSPQLAFCQAITAKLATDALFPYFMVGISASKKLYHTYNLIISFS